MQNHRWCSEVRPYELDAQGIVNNANYFCYLDAARTKMFLDMGLDCLQWHGDGFDFVLYKTNLTFKSSLRAHDSFCVVSEAVLRGVRMQFTQRIMNETNGLPIVEAESTVVCKSIQTGKPCLPDALRELLLPR